MIKTYPARKDKTSSWSGDKVSVFFEIVIQIFDDIFAYDEQYHQAEATVQEHEADVVKYNRCSVRH